MSCPDGYSKFDRLRVIDACEKYIKNREDYIERKREEMIQKEMSHGITFLGRTWFAKNREHVIKSLAGDTWSEYGCIPAGRVESVLTMATVSEEDSIFLSDEIVSRIANFME